MEYQMPAGTNFQTLVFGWLGVVALGWMAVAGHGPGVVIAGALAVLIAGWQVKLIVRVARKRPVVVLTADEVRIWNGSYAKWSEIVSVRIISRDAAGNRRAIDFKLRDPEAYVARSGLAVKRYAKSAMRQGRGPMWLPEQLFTVPLEEVVATMARVHPGLKVKP
ncbi:hypothetical protein ACFQ9X_03525 [Catenulispora yoronensis]